MLSLYLVTLFLVTVFARSTPFMQGEYGMGETEEVRNAAYFATEAINREMGDSGQYWYTLMRIYNPRRQFSSGYRYRMEVVMQESDCLYENRNFGSPMEPCRPRPDGMERRCRVEVLRGFGNGDYNSEYYQFGKGDTSPEWYWFRNYNSEWNQFRDGDYNSESYRFRNGDYNSEWNQFRAGDYSSESYEFRDGDYNSEWNQFRDGDDISKSYQFRNGDYSPEWYRFGNGDYRLEFYQCN